MSIKQFFVFYISSKKKSHQCKITCKKRVNKHVNSMRVMENKRFCTTGDIMAQFPLLPLFSDLRYEATCIIYKP